MKTLTKKELSVQQSFFHSLPIPKRKTKKPLIVAMLGLVGSGKITIGREIAKQIGAAFISGDAIRIALRKQRQRYDAAYAIALQSAEKAIQKGANVVLDFDAVGRDKHNMMVRKTKGVGARSFFVRTYANMDVAIGRIITASYRNHPEDFFGGAYTDWKGSGQSRGSVVKIREMWRRTPHHYQWVDRVGGRWVLRKLPFRIDAAIDTTEPKHWRKEIKKFVKKVLKM